MCFGVWVAGAVHPHAVAARDSDAVARHAQRCPPHGCGVVQVEGGERLLDRVRGLPRVVVRDLVAAPHTPAVRERKEVAAAGGE